MIDYPLTPWEKISIMFIGGSVAGLTLLVVVCFVCPTCLFYRILNKSKETITLQCRGVFRFLKPGWLRGENVVQVKHFDACTLYFLKNRGGQNHPNHPGNYTSVYVFY